MLRSDTSRCAIIYRENAFKYTLEYWLKSMHKHIVQYAAKHTEWHTFMLLNCTFYRKLWRCSQVHFRVLNPVQLQIWSGVYIRLHYQFILPVNTYRNLDVNSQVYFCIVSLVPSQVCTLVWFCCTQYTKARYFCHRESQKGCGSYCMTIQGSSNCVVACTNAVNFRFSWKQLWHILQ